MIPARMIRARMIPARMIPARLLAALRGTAKRHAGHAIAIGVAPSGTRVDRESHELMSRGILRERVHLPPPNIRLMRHLDRRPAQIE